MEYSFSEKNLWKELIKEYSFIPESKLDIYFSSFRAKVFSIPSCLIKKNSFNSSYDLYNKILLRKNLREVLYKIDMDKDSYLKLDDNSLIINKEFHPIIYRNSILFFLDGLDLNLFKNNLGRFDLSLESINQSSSFKKYILKFMKNLLSVESKGEKKEILRTKIRFIMERNLYTPDGNEKLQRVIISGFLLNILKIIKNGIDSSSNLDDKKFIDKYLCVFEKENLIKEEILNINSFLNKSFVDNDIPILMNINNDNLENSINNLYEKNFIDLGLKKLLLLEK